jgi:hypothetical protein
MPLDDLLKAQATWAARRWPGHVGRRAPSLDENLIFPLTIEARREFEAGSGGELGRNGKPGKMSSLRSSSALSYNVFQPWRGLDLQPLAAALQTTVNSRELRFEQKFRHGLRSTPPNLDVVLDVEQPRPMGIECKFTEPYGPKKDHAPLDEKYLVGDRARWTEVNLPRAQELAASVGNTFRFKRLAAGQLLKHILGLAWTTRQSPRLRYVWFDTDCVEASEHRDELTLFEAQLDHGIDFAALTYQELMESLFSQPEPINGYRSYLKERYFVT